MRGSEGALTWRLNSNLPVHLCLDRLVMTMTFFLYTIKDRDEWELMDEIYLPFLFFSIV